MPPGFNAPWFMPYLKLTNDRIVRRLRWLVVGIIFADAALTLLGQPSTYWHNYQTALEGNPFFRQYLCRGYIPFGFVVLILATFAFSTISILPRRAALAVIFACLFAGFFCTESWLMLRWKLGGNGLSIHGLLLGVAVVLLAFPKPPGDPQTPPKAD
jgi:hypothetical protein